MTGIAVFVSILLLTQLLTYQQYLIYENSELERVSIEANRISDRLKTSLSFSLSATKTLTYIIQEYGVPRHFDSVAISILESNRYIDALQLTRNGLITHVYPLKGNEKALGYDILTDPKTRDEALKALSKKELYFAGPFNLIQGGMAVVGRLPVFKDNAFWGFSVVIIRLPTLLKAAGIEDTNGKYTYQLSKINPRSGEEEYFLPGDIEPEAFFVSVEVPDGEWKLYVISADSTNMVLQVLPFSMLGILLSATAGFFAWHLARQPLKLKIRVNEIAAEMNELQRSSTESLKKANRLYHFTSRINDIMVHVNNEQTLFDSVCNLAYTIGKFRLAWIGNICHEEQNIRSVSCAGDDVTYVSDITPISLKSNDVEGPAKVMLRTGGYVLCNDIATEPLMKPWAERALLKGYKSAIFLPIHKFGNIIGIFSLYSDGINSFDEKEVQLLLETADNISFTLDNFEREKLRKQAEAQIHSEKMLSDSIINSLPGVFYLYDRNGKFLRWNKNFEIVTKYQGNEIAEMHPLDFFDGDSKMLLRQKISDVFENGYADVMAEFCTRDRVMIPYFFSGRKVTFNEVEYLIGMGVDISDRVKAEQALLERTEEIEKLSAHLQNIREEERSQIALEIHDVLGQQLTALKMDATWIRKRSAPDQVLDDRISAMIGLIDDTIKTVRRISSELRPGILDDLGLVAALEWQGSEFKKNTGIDLVFHSNTSDLEADRHCSINVFRIYQEALTNIARHAHATQVRADFIIEPDHIQLTISDNGKGINFEEAGRKKSLGLISMKERARQLGGELVIENNLPSGTVVKLKLPHSGSQPV